MQRHFVPLVLRASLLLLGLAPVAPHAAAQQASPAVPRAYRAVDLGTLGGPTAGGIGINASGWVVGDSDIAVPAATPGAGAKRPRHAFLWDGKTMQDLGTLGGSTSIALNINASGQIAGTADTADGHTHAVMWDNGKMIDLGTLGGADSFGVSINDAGQVAGWSTTAPGQKPGDPGTHAVVWDHGKMTDLGTLGGPVSRANTINNRGQVAGASIDAAGRLRPFLWQDGTMTDLGALPGYTAGRSATLNNRGDVAGWSELTGGVVTNSFSGGSHRAFLYRDGRVNDLGTLPGFEASSAVGVNDEGWVVGDSSHDQPPGATATTQPVTPHGFIWVDGTMTDLNDLLEPGSGLEVRRAIRVNNAGQIAGGCAGADGKDHACLLTPVS